VLGSLFPASLCTSSNIACRSPLLQASFYRQPLQISVSQGSYYAEIYLCIITTSSFFLQFPHHLFRLHNSLLSIFFKVVFEPGSRYVAQVVLKLGILLPLPPKYWASHVCTITLSSSFLHFKVLFTQFQNQCHLF
jgi:hypothetical protein